jgi:hypothetical protein
MKTIIFLLMMGIILGSCLSRRAVKQPNLTDATPSEQYFGTEYSLSAAKATAMIDNFRHLKHKKKFGNPWVSYDTMVLHKIVTDRFVDSFKFVPAIDIGTGDSFRLPTIIIVVFLNPKVNLQTGNVSDKTASHSIAMKPSGEEGIINIRSFKGGYMPYLIYDRLDFLPGQTSNQDNNSTQKNSLTNFSPVQYVSYKALCPPPPNGCKVTS